VYESKRLSFCRKSWHTEGWLGAGRRMVASVRGGAVMGRGSNDGGEVPVRNRRVLKGWDVLMTKKTGRCAWKEG